MLLCDFCAIIYNNNNNNNNNNSNRDSTFLSIFAVPDNAVCWITFTLIRFNFKEYMKRIGVNVRLEVIQKTALLGKAKILRKVLSLYEEGKERPGSRGELL